MIKNVSFFPKAIYSSYSKVIVLEPCDYIQMGIKSRVIHYIPKLENLGNFPLLSQRPGFVYIPKVKKNQSINKGFGVGSGVSMPKPVY